MGNNRDTYNFNKALYVRSEIDWNMYTHCSSMRLLGRLLPEIYTTVNRAIFVLVFDFANIKGATQIDEKHYEVLGTVCMPRATLSGRK